MALVLYSFSLVFKDTERSIRQKGSHCNYENLLLSLPQSKCIHILSDIKKKHEQRGSHPSFLSVTTTDTTTSSRRERANTSRPHSLVTQRSQGRDSRGISWQNLLECCWLAFSLAAEFLYLVDAPPPTPAKAGPRTSCFHHQSRQSHGKQGHRQVVPILRSAEGPSSLALWIVSKEKLTSPMAKNTGLVSFNIRSYLCCALSSLTIPTQMIQSISPFVSSR